MENATCNVLYVNRRAPDQIIRRDTFFDSNDPLIKDTLHVILTTFPSVQTFSTGSACLSKILDSEHFLSELSPTLVLIDIPQEEEQKLKRLSRDAKLSAQLLFRTESLNDPDADIYGTQLLSHISSEIQIKKLPRLIIPIAIICESNSSSGTDDTHRLMRFMDAGAIDVMIYPITKNRIQGLATHAYRIFKEVTNSDSSFLGRNRSRKMSWVGVEEEKPYAYLRESMVSNLMSGICRPETDLTPAISDFVSENGDHHPYTDWDSQLDYDRKKKVSHAIGTWKFSAHEFYDDELVYAAITMLDHALTMPELSHWKIDKEEIFVYLQACRVSYNDFVHYHNFRHVVDVLQAVFFFLVSIGNLPPYPPSSPSIAKTELASLVTPFDSLCLLVSAIGHDVGHPGVNNAFLVALNSPLAQLYNDRSVLESFHCAAYSQILRRHWSSAFKDTQLRRLMINSILATDMGLHFKYMADMERLNGILKENPNIVSTLDDKQKDDYRDLLCGLLIKCADISNVARSFECARRWADILTDEFANQGAMEEDLGMTSCLFGGPPVLGDLIKLGQSQIGFMGFFARPLFEGVQQLFPPMTYTLKELDINKNIWETKVEDERKRFASLKSSNPENVDDTTPSASTSARGDSITSDSAMNTNPKSSPHTSTDLRSPSRDSTASSTTTPTNGQISPVSISVSSGFTGVTSTALPLQQIMESYDDAFRGRRIDVPNSNKDNHSFTSHSDPRPLDKKSRQRATSAYHADESKKPNQNYSSISESPPIPNGLSNTLFAASETDVNRYLSGGPVKAANGSITGSSNEVDHRIYMHGGSSELDCTETNPKGGPTRKFSVGFRRLFKRSRKQMRSKESNGIVSVEETEQAKTD